MIFLVGFFRNLVYTLCNINNKKSFTAFSKIEPLRVLIVVKEGESKNGKRVFCSDFFETWHTYSVIQKVKIFFPNFPSKE